MKQSGVVRLLFLGGGLLVGVLIVLLSSLALAEDGTFAKLLLDKRSGPQVFPFPFTIQNLTWILFGIGIGEVSHRWRFAGREARAARLRLLPEDGQTVLMPSDMRETLQRARSSPAADSFLVGLIDQCVLQFQANHRSEQAHDLLGSMVDLEMHRVELRYTLLRYLVWVVPTFGFIGTVVGIAGALSALQTGADSLMDQMQPVVDNLAMAFNTTILALCLSAVLVLLLQFTQKREEDAMNASADYCLRNLINRLYAPPAAA